MSDVATLEFDTLEVIAVSVAAYEFNNGYVKTSEYDYNANQPLPEVKKYPNKELVRAYFGVDHYSVEAPRPPLVKVTDAHRMKAEDIRNYSKKAVFKILGKKNNTSPFVLGGLVLDSVQTSTYEEDLYQFLNQDKASLSVFGYIASAPLYYENGKRRDYIKTRLEELDSKHVGMIGGRIILNEFEVIRNTKSKNFDGHIIQGICDGNLFLYFASRPSGHIKVGDIIHIEGKVRDHVMEKETIPMTKLNRVIERNVNNDNVTKEAVVRIDSDCDLFG